MTLKEQFSRLIQILQLIGREAWTWDAADMEAKFEVARATIGANSRAEKHHALKGKAIRVQALSG